MQYPEYFMANDNWLCDFPDPTPHLQMFYPEFFRGNHVNHDLLIEMLSKLSYQRNPLLKKAREMFKAIFNLEYKCIPGKSDRLSSTDVISKISKIYGHNISAHGVEEQKGGIYSILLMCVSGYIVSRLEHWGSFKNGPPMISPLCHGPYYIIYSTKGEMPARHPTSLLEAEYILVPFKENVETIKQKLNEIVKIGYISHEKQKLYATKLIDYQSFHDKLAAMRGIIHRA